MKGIKKVKNQLLIQQIHQQTLELTFLLTEFSDVEKVFKNLKKY